MKGDFSRLSFDRRRHFSTVWLQQGRVLTDADFNEQAAIQQDFLRRFVVDLVGPRWRVGDGFALAPVGAGDFAIAPGRFYLGGLLCANDTACTWRTQPFPPDAAAAISAGVAYLEVFERAVSAAEDPALLEPALGGADTSVRGQIVWQIRLLGAAGAAALAQPVAAALKQRAAEGYAGARDSLRRLTAALKAFTRAPGNAGTADTLFDLLDSARPRLTVRTADGYRGAESRLYRIEIHDPGTAGAASIKWSRDNGGTVFAVLRLDVAGGTVTATLATRDLSALHVDDWVELCADANVFARSPAPLLRIAAIDTANATVTLAGAMLPLAAGAGVALRRWDQRDGTNRGGTVAIVEGRAMALDDGVELHFAPGGNYDSGDYWTVPARPEIGEIMWPVDAGGMPRAQVPHGPCRHRAALASLTKKGRAWQIRNYRPRR